MTVQIPPTFCRLRRTPSVVTVPEPVCPGMMANRLIAVAVMPENEIALVLAVTNTTGLIAPFTHDVVAVYLASLIPDGIAAG